jgi:hypothetical protein
MLILQAAQEVVKEEGFDDLLDSVRGRIDEIESLHRTSELTVCTHILYRNSISQSLLSLKTLIAEIAFASLWTKAGHAW